MSPQSLMAPLKKQRTDFESASIPRLPVAFHRLSCNVGRLQGADFFRSTLEAQGLPLATAVGCVCEPGTQKPWGIV